MSPRPDGWGWIRSRSSASARDNAQTLQAGRDIVIKPSLPAGSDPAGLTGKVWNIPRPVATFTARDTELAGLTEKFSRPDAGTVVLHGIPGVGKTQLAFAWAHRHAGELKAGWRVRAADRLTAVADLAQLANRLGIAEDADQEAAAAAVVEALSGHEDWLLVFDDATPASVRDLLPHRGGQVLLTSRSPIWATVAQPMEVGLFAPQAAAAFLDPGHEPPSGAAMQLAERLGYLPLALEQARAYCAATGRSLDGYLADYRQQRLLQHGIDESLHASVVATVTLSLTEVRRRDPAAAQLMLLWAHLAPTPIPRDLPAAAPQSLPEPLQQVVQAGSTTLDDTIAVLVDLALATVERAGQLGVHQLVAEILREQPAPVPERRSRRLFRSRDRRGGHSSTPPWPAIAATLLSHAMPGDAAFPRNWDRYALLLPHATAVIERAGYPGTEPAGLLGNQCGLYLKKRGEYEPARRLLQEALATNRRVLGEEHPSTLTSTGNLASTLIEQGELVAARELLERVVETRRRVLSEEHPDTLTSMNNLASVFRMQGELVAARELSERVVETRRRVLGEHHPSTLTSMNNLALVMRAQGELVAARELLEQVLETRRRVLDEEHLDTLASMNNLASVLRAQGELVAARQLHEKELAVARRVLGEEHPSTLNSLNNLALVIREQGEVVAARELFERVVAVWRRVLGEKHPSTLTSMNNLALVMRAQGELVAARELFERVLETRRRMLGEKHPDTLTSMEDLTEVLRRLSSREIDEDEQPET